ncbi:MAG TPA: hypothetical protein VGQ17_08655 [Gemmatimonadales bacterium]|jgi:hypothetical protein|nr:hypothetical protein [Gemmatimonadales bacterium]
MKDTHRAPTTLLVSDPARLTVLDARRPPRDYQEAYDALPSGGYVAAALRLDAPSHRARIPHLLFLRFRLAGLRRTLARIGAVHVRRFALYPNLAEPSLAYELGSPAERYAERGLLPRSRSWLFAIGRIGLHRWAGCHPSVAAVLIVGQKP